MILLLAALSAHALEFGVNGGVAVAPATSEFDSRSAGAGSLYGALGVLGLIRGEAHVAYTGLATEPIANGANGRAVDVRVMGGVSLPIVSPPLAEFGADILVGPDLRFTHTTTDGSVLTSNQVDPSVHLGLSAGPYLELPLLRFGLRGWLDVPGQPRLGVSAMAGVRI